MDRHAGIDTDAHKGTHRHRQRNTETQGFRHRDRDTHIQRHNDAETK